jgi:hypothetical protein
MICRLMSAGISARSISQEHLENDSQSKARAAMEKHLTQGMKVLRKGVVQ